MKVLHVAPSISKAYGGPTESLIGYIVAARTAGIEISVAAPECSAVEASVFARRAGDVPCHLFPSFGSGAFEISPSLHFWLRSSARSFDVVHVHGLFNTTSSFAVRTCVSRDVPVVIRPFGTLSRYTFLHRRTTLKRAWLALTERNNVRNASAIHFTTFAERSNAEWHEISFDGRSHVIPPPFVPGDVAARAKEWDSLHPSILFLGRVEPVKNVEALLDAWPGVLSVAPNAKLTIAGAGTPTYMRFLADRAKSLGVAETVTFPGFADAAMKRRLLESASVFVLPSHHENFGIAVIEALDAAMPVVVSRDVQLAPFVASNGLGIVTETGPAPLAASIIRCLEDRELREHVRTCATSALMATFSPEVTGQLLLEMYQAAIRSKNKPAD